MKRRTFRSRFDMRLHQLQDKADEVQSSVRGQATALAKQAQKGLMQGKDAVMSWENTLEKSIRENPMLYIGAAMALIGLLLAKAIIDRRSK